MTRENHYKRWTADDKLQESYWRSNGRDTDYIARKLKRSASSVLNYRGRNHVMSGTDKPRARPQGDNPLSGHYVARIPKWLCVGTIWALATFVLMVLFGK